MEISNQLREAAIRTVERYIHEEVKLPAEIPNNPGMCLGSDKEKDLLKVFSTIEHKGKTYLIGSCI